MPACRLNATPDQLEAACASLPSGADHRKNVAAITRGWYIRSEPVSRGLLDVFFGLSQPAPNAFAWRALTEGETTPNRL